MDLQLFLALILVVIGGVFVVLALAPSAEPELDDAGEYLRSLDMTPEEADEFQQMLAEPFLTRVLRPLGSQFLGSVASLLPGNYRDSIHLQLVHAGLSGQFRAEEIITTQVLGGVAGFLLALLLIGTTVVTGNLAVVTLLFLPLVGAMLPKVWINRKVEERREAILKDLPDTLDLLAISVEAGVGFEGALGIVCENFDSPLADEFSRTLREMELGLPRREALQNLKRRTEVPELSNFVLTLTQADALGMPIGRVLKTQADEMRSKRKQWAREKAAKLPVKILFPLVLFIFPSIFVVVLGPAGSQIGSAFK
jgi:tight adherence protein C